MNAEDFVIRLHDQVSPGARVAENALSQLEARIQAQRAALAGYEAQLEAAAGKLEAVAAGGDKGFVNVAQARRAQAEVARLQEAVDGARGAMDRLAGARPLAAQVSTLQQARGAITAAADAIAELEAQQHLLASSGGATKAQIDAITAALQRQRAALRQAQQGYVRLGGSSREALAAGGSATAKVGAMGQQAKGAKINLEEMSSSLGQLGGPLGTAGSRASALGSAFQKLKGLGRAGPIAAIVVVVVALTAALVAAAAAATRFAIGMANAARNQRLAFESAAANYSALDRLGTILPQVQRRTGLATEEIQRLATDLAKAKTPANRLESALDAMATATAGGAGPEYLEKLQRALVATGRIPPELAAQFSRFEAVAKKKMISLESQGAILKRNFGALFADLKIEGFLKKLTTLVSLFDESTASGRALKWMAETLFQPMIDSATRAIPKMERFFLRIVIAALKAYIAVKTFFRTDEGKTFEAVLRAIGSALAWVVKLWASVQAAGLHAVFSYAAFAGRTLLTVITALAPAWQVLSAGAKKAWAAVASSVQGAIAYLKGVSLSEIGSAMINGLVTAIKNGASAVKNAVVNAVDGAIQAAKEKLGIASPSRVFMRIGAQTAEGMALGVQARTSAVHDVISEMALPTEVANENAAPAPRQAAAGDTSNGPTFNFHGCHFGGDLTEEKLEEMLFGIWQRNALAGAG